MIRGYLAFRPEEIRKIFEMLDHAAEGCTGHGLVHLLVYSASLLDWTWNAGIQAWSRPGLPELHILTGPTNIHQMYFRCLGFQGCQRLLTERWFRGGPFWDIVASQQPFVSSHVRERDKGLHGGILGVCGMDFLLGQVRGEVVPCWCCGGLDGDGHLFLDCTYPPLVSICGPAELSSLCLGTRLIGQDACNGMVGYHLCLVT